MEPTCTPVSAFITVAVDVSVPSATVRAPVNGVGHSPRSVSKSGPGGGKAIAREWLQGRAGSAGNVDLRA